MKQILARPAKMKVDYFPHMTHTGKTIAILEAHWGNDGYAFWFKLLELLGDTDSFSYDCNRSSEWEYLLSKTLVDGPVALAILNKLAEIEAIDAELWTQKIVWSDHFISNLEPLFERRKSEAPNKPGLRLAKPVAEEVSGEYCDENSGETAIIPTETDKVKKSKVEESKGEKREPEEPEERERACAGAGAPIGTSVSVAATDEAPRADADLSGPLKKKRCSRKLADTVNGANYQNDNKRNLSWSVRRDNEKTGFPGHGRRFRPVDAAGYG